MFRYGSYYEVFVVLLIFVLFNVMFVMMVCWLYFKLEDFELVGMCKVGSDGFLRCYWVYLLGVVLVVIGFVDYLLVVYYLVCSDVISIEWIVGFYVVVMVVSGMVFLVLGCLFDCYGFWVLIVLIVVILLFVLLVFFGCFMLVLVGVVLWGMGMGVYEFIILVVVVLMVFFEWCVLVFGLFIVGYGMFWFLGSVVIGYFYDYFVVWMVVFCMVI